MTFKIEWIDKGREPQCEPDPAYPNGMDISLARSGEKSCTTAVPYPAKRCGMHVIECKECGVRVAITTAGRPDDPRSVRIPCNKRRGTLDAMTTLHRETLCPACSKGIDAATSTNAKRATPEEGDVSVCFGCGAFLAFNADLSLRILTLLEIGELPDEARITMQRARKEIEQLKGGER